MKADSIHLSAAMRELASDHFRLLQSANLKKRRDTVELRLSGYSDVMYLIADIVKVSILALGDGENSNHIFIPDPASNVSGVLSVILDLLPYEEAELLDKIRYASLEPQVVEEQDWDFILKSISLSAPSILSEN